MGKSSDIYRRKYPKPLTRGYYSELITYPESLSDFLGATKRINLKWQVKTPEHAPLMFKLQICKRKTQLAPTERWITYKEDRSIRFPIETFGPKVQMPLEVDAGVITRNIATERLLRKYQAMNIKDVLANVNVTYEDLLPVREDILSVSDDCKSANYIPLELVDDEEYDCRTPENWLDMLSVREMDNPILPGLAFVPIVSSLTTNEVVYDWINVAITDYDFETKLWTVLTIDGYKRTFQMPRIYVMFKAENPETFTARIKSALRYRKTATDRIRYQFYLNCMILDGMPNMSDEILNKLATIIGSKYKSDDSPLYDKLLREVLIAFKKVHIDINNRYQFKKNPSKFTRITIPTRTCADMVPKLPIDTKMRSFKNTREYFRWISIYVIPETYRAVYRVVAECMKIENVCLFTVSYGSKLISLEEFDAVQSHHTNTVMKHLTGPWLETLVFNMRMCLGDIRKGWFDLNEKYYEVFAMAKLVRLMDLVKFRMQYALRLLVENSIQTYVNLLETPCLTCLDVEEDFEWGRELLTTQFQPKSVPLFSIHLKMNDAGAYYSTDPDVFRVVLLKLYDNALKMTHQIRPVHPLLLSKLRFDPDVTLSSVGLLADEVSCIRDRFLFAYEKAIIPLKAYAREYNAYLELFVMDIHKYVEKYKEEQHSAYEIKEEVNIQRSLKQNLEMAIPPNIVIGPFIVMIDQLKTFLVNKRQEISIKLLDMFADRLRGCMEAVNDEYKLLMTKLGEKPDSIERVFELRDWMETIPMLVRAQDDLARRYMMEYDIMDYFWYNISDDDFEQKWEAIGWPLRIRKEVEVIEEFLKEEEDRFYKMQVNDEFVLEDKIETYTVQVVQMSKLRDFSKCHEIAVDMRRLWKAMKEAQDLGRLLNQRQKLFNTPVVPFENLARLIKEFEPYKTLWITASDWLRQHEIWMDNPILNIDSEAIERTVNEMYKTMVKSARIFSDIPAVEEVIMDLKQEIEDFKPYIPLIQSLRNPGMRQRHWDIFREKTGISIVWTPIITFKDCLEMGVANYQTEIVTIASSATKEYDVEKGLEKMMAEWENNVMELTPYKDTGTYIVKIPDEIQQTLDDHLVTTQQLSFSPFKGPFEAQIDEWEETLKITSEVIEEWINLQRQWMYLEPILSSEDISRQLPAEAKKYKAMERTWRRIMRGAVDNPYILRYCGDKRLLESLKDSSHVLDVVHKGLSEYLETKRIIFPRLYFLSDDELLEILSHTKNPLAVQPHLRKCFENIATLKFEDDLRITQMFSAEEECVDLDPTLYPKGSVENWLLLVEKSMRNTVRSTLGKSLLQINEVSRKEWVLNWPGQVVIAGSQTFWTTGVEGGIRQHALDDFLQNVLLTNLDALRSLVKGSLTYLQREILSALIVIEVHSRDVTQTLVDLQIDAVTDFDWISQLRYYWIEEELKVRAVNAEFPYGYEYLGNSGRLVITPLTDRCYLTLTGALHLKFGGAPAGPAGTGKTETTKDLAKAFAIQCVVFNCSDQLDFMAMGKFFKGLASSGAWACFDEFNRIDIEVLSVVAQQITTIQKAQQARLDRFIFEDVEIDLKESCAVFITMNPGYAGRTELPDNLKALFRPVSMMVPNYTLIAEISLFSFGFGNAKELAHKITTTFKLSSEQLSTQDHYDFGMRAVKTVIAVAGNLKREKPNMDEKQICLRALRDVNVPKFLKDDLKLFNGIVSDLFPKMVEEVVDYGELERSIKSSCTKLGLESVDGYVKKVIQLYETTVVRHGLMLVGPTASGKTKCYLTLQDAMTALQGQPQPSGYPFRPVYTYVLNPKSITMGQLYGEFDLQTHEWTDGILPCLVRIGVAAEDKDKRWYIFDGPVDAVWIENMNTVLDDNKKLCLSSGEIIKLRDTMTMVFEVADLAVASPATVSRCGMVYLEPEILGLQPFINCWFNRLPALAASFVDELRELIEYYVLPAIAMVRKQLREVLTSVDSALLANFLHLMDYRFGPISGRDNRPPPPAQYLELLRKILFNTTGLQNLSDLVLTAVFAELLVPFVVFSMIWSVGCTCDNDGRTIFSQWVRKRMEERHDEPLFPEHGAVYDFRLHDGGYTDPTEDNQPMPPTWHNWMEKALECEISVDMKYSDIEIPTINNVRNAYMIEVVLNNDCNVLCVGPTGTGKTQTVVGKLSTNMPKKFICDFLSFSARTTANQTQNILDSKLDRRRRGVFGPPVLKRQVFFIDDFNMPALEVYGAQPPIELIRQWMDYGGWYDRKTVGDFRYIIDINFCTAMGPPGGGRNPVTARLLRHFHYLAFTELEDDSNRTIFGTILQFWIKRITVVPLREYYEAILVATLSVYHIILEELLPTPAKTHYTFNLRDLSKVFQGVLMFDPMQIQAVSQLMAIPEIAYRTTNKNETIPPKYLSTKLINQGDIGIPGSSAD